MKILFGFTFLILIVSFITGFYFLKRTVNYKLYYKNQVKNTIIEMVNKNCLKGEEN
jgi:hypothetical protein